MPELEGKPPLVVAAATDPGRKRERNEDAFGYALTSSGGVFMIADGMGGHSQGELAAKLAVETALSVLEGKTISPGLLVEALEAANRRIYEASHLQEGESMGTTATLLAIDAPFGLVAHVGDSRAYLLRDGLLVQLTQDHSWVADRVRQGLLRPEEARTHRWRNVITNALGTFPEVEVDLLGLRLRPGDVFLLSTDGLHGVVGEETLARVLAQEPPAVAVEKLIELANAWGGPDNITAMVVGVRDVKGDANKPYALALAGDQPVYIRSRSGDAVLALPHPRRRSYLVEAGLLVLWLLLLAYVLWGQR